MRSKDDAPETVRVNAGVMLKPLALKKLGRSIEYHQQMAEACKKDDAKLAATHADAAKQLQEVVAAAPGMSAIDVALAKRTVRRVLH